jgi:hypothetical protein
MAIVYKKMRWTGHLGVVKTDKFGCMVSIAPEGLFKGWSAVISIFDPAMEWSTAARTRCVNVIAKALLHPQLTKIGRAAVLDALLDALNDVAETPAEERPLSPGSVLQLVLSRLNSSTCNNVVIDFKIDPALLNDRDTVMTREFLKSEEAIRNGMALGCGANASAFRCASAQAGSGGSGIKRT